MGGHRGGPLERRTRHAAVDDPAIVLEAALRFLETRARSVAEVRRRLTGVGYRPELVDGAIARLTGLGMLDDAAFAAAWVESRDRARPRGELAIRRELRLKGVDGATIDQALEVRRVAARERATDQPGQPEETDDVRSAGDAPDADDIAAARLLERHARSLGRIADPRARRQRAYALLARHGFDPETCARLAASAWRLTPRRDGP